MPTLSGSVDVEAPREKVFEFIATPEKAPTFIPGLDRISNVGPPQPAVGRTWDFEFNWFGLIISGQSECTRADRPSLYQFQTKTGSKSTWTYRFEPQGNGTRVSLDIEYEEPANLVAKFASGGVLRKMNEDRGRETLQNLKAIFE